jgi:hypothetical protein
MGNIALDSAGSRYGSVELWEILHLIHPAHDMVQWSYGKYYT